MQSIKSWIQNSNGWQRLWLVSSVAGVLYFSLVWPFTENSSGNQYRYQRLRDIEAEMSKPECAVYMSQPFSQLAQPNFPTKGEGCYYIYTHRKFLAGNMTITKEKYLNDFESEYRQRLVETSVAGFLMATTLSALLYGLGVLVAWVIKGFKKKEL